MTITAPRVAAVALLCSLAAHAAAQTPQFLGFRCLLRESFGIPPFRLPVNASIVNATPAVNDQRLVAIKVLGASGGANQGVWLGDASSGSVVYVAPSVDSIVSDVSLNESGLAAWSQFFGPDDGVYRRAPGTGIASRITTGPIGATAWSSTQVNDVGLTAWRAGFATGNAYVSFDSGAFTFYAIENNVQPPQPYGFLFTPSLNNQGRIAGKVALGTSTGPQEIRRFEPSGAFTVMARAVASDPQSIFQSFDNSVSLDNLGRVAFIASLTPAAGGGRGVFISDGSTITTVARSGQGGISGASNNIEFFAPALSERGFVAFRAFNDAGQRSIWVGDGASLRQLATRGTVVPSDRGDLIINEPSGGIYFSANPAVNPRGDVVFAATVTTTAGQGQGRVLLIALAACRADLNADGVVDFNDLLEYLNLYNAQDPDADLNADGVVDFNDLLEYLNRYNEPC